VGVALDVCVLYTAMDAAALGYRVAVFLEGCAATSKQAGAEAVEKMESLGVVVCNRPESLGTGP